MKLKPIHTLLLLLLLFFGQLSAAATQPVGTAMSAIQMSADMTLQIGEDCDEDCEITDTVCADDCMVELSCCTSLQGAVLLPTAIDIGDHTAKRLFTEPVSSYHYQSLSSIYHPPQS